MLRLYASRYDKLRLKFLANAVKPTCVAFKSEKMSECRTCHFNKVCGDIRRLQNRINQLLEEL